jgi:hypothetical protein
LILHQRHLPFKHHQQVFLANRPVPLSEHISPRPISLNLAVFVFLLYAGASRILSSQKPCYAKDQESSLL